MSIKCSVSEVGPRVGRVKNRVFGQRRGDHQQPACRWLGGNERRMVRRQVSVGYDALHSHWKVHTSHPMRNGPEDSASSGAVAMTSRDFSLFLCVLYHARGHLVPNW